MMTVQNQSIFPVCLHAHVLRYSALASDILDQLIVKSARAQTQRRAAAQNSASPLVVHVLRAYVTEIFQHCAVCALQNERTLSGRCHGAH